MLMVVWRWYDDESGSDSGVVIYLLRPAGLGEGRRS